MKKTIFSSVLLLVVLASASAAMAVVTIEGATTIGSASNSFTPSAKVGLSVTATTIAYAATSCHLNGTLQYGTVGGTGTAKDASKIYSSAIISQTGKTIGYPQQTDSATDLPTGSWQ